MLSAVKGHVMWPVQVLSKLHRNYVVLVFVPLCILRPSSYCSVITILLYLCLDLAQVGTPSSNVHLLFIVQGLPVRDGGWACHDTAAVSEQQEDWWGTAPAAGAATCSSTAPDSKSRFAAEHQCMGYLFLTFCDNDGNEFLLFSLICSRWHSIDLFTF